jgi:hypothetical protein
MKIRRADHTSVGKYKGSAHFSELENWVTNLVVMLEAIQYGGDDRDRERLLCIPEFLTDEAKKWFNRHVIHTNRTQPDWKFEQVITGLYDRFVHATTMQEARDTYATARYTSQLGIQGFYDTLIDHAQNMSVYPDAYNIMDTFLKGIPSEMRVEMLRNGLTPEANTVEDFVAEAKALEAAAKTEKHYSRYTMQTPAAPKPTPTHEPRNNGVSNERHEFRPRKVGVTFMKRSEIPQQGSSSRPRAFLKSRNTFGKPKDQEHQHDKPKGHNDPHQPKNERTQDKSQNKDQGHQHSPDVTCYNCGEKGHISPNCKKPKRVHIRAAHTEVPYEPHDGNDQEGKGEPSDAEDRGYEAEYDDDDEEIVEVEVYENEHYSREMDTKHAFMFRTRPTDGKPQNKGGDDHISTVAPDTKARGDFEDSKTRIRKVNL